MTEVKENSLIVELRTFAKLIGEEGRQAEFYRQMLKDAKPIEVVRLSEVFSDTEIKAIKRFVNPKAKECFRNATLFAHIYPEVKYVEGKMTVCGTFGTEHAWNKVGDKYVDITMELASIIFAPKLIVTNNRKLNWYDKDNRSKTQERRVFLDYPRARQLQFG